MKKIRIHDPKDGPWHNLKDLTPKSLLDEFSENELNSTIFFHEEGSETAAQLTEAIYAPGFKTEVHAHHVNQIFYILEGEMHIGSRVLTPGCSIFIAEDTFYSLGAGEEGLRFLTIRPRADLSYVKSPRNAPKGAAAAPEEIFSVPGG